MATVGGMDVKEDPSRTIGLNHALAHVSTTTEDDVSRIKFEHNPKENLRGWLRVSACQSYSECCKRCYKGKSVKTCRDRRNSCPGVGNVIRTRKTSDELQNGMPEGRLSRAIHEWTWVRISLFCTGFQFRFTHGQQCEKFKRRDIEWQGIKNIFEQELKIQNNQAGLAFKNIPLPEFTVIEGLNPVPRTFFRRPNPDTVFVYTTSDNFETVIKEALKRMRFRSDFRYILQYGVANIGRWNYNPKKYYPVTFLFK